MAHARSVMQRHKVEKAAGAYDIPRDSATTRRVLLHARYMALITITDRPDPNPVPNPATADLYSLSMSYFTSSPGLSLNFRVALSHHFSSAATRLRPLLPLKILSVVSIRLLPMKTRTLRLLSHRSSADAYLIYRLPPGRCYPHNPCFLPALQAADQNLYLTVLTSALCFPVPTIPLQPRSI